MTYIRRLKLAIIAIVLIQSLAPHFSANAQDARELEQERAASRKLKGEHPLVQLMRSRKSTLRPL